MESKVIVDQSNWGHIAVTGADRKRFLNGMVTGNVGSLAPGQWLRALILTHKARVISIVDIHAMEDRFVLSCEPSLTQKTLDTLDRHIVMDDVELQEVDLPMHTIWASTEDVWNMAPVFAVAKDPSEADLVETWRIEAGMPRYGADVSEDNFPFESPLIRLVDYEKGCFAGQEPVARVNARGGGGNKRLCGLLSTSPLTKGATVATQDKERGGIVTSVASSEIFGDIALAYLHKSAWDPGSVVQIGSQEATVSILPFAKH